MTCLCFKNHLNKINYLNTFKILKLLKILRFAIILNGFYLLLSATPQLAKAQFIDANILSFSDTFKTSSTQVISRSIYDIGLGTLMGRSDSWLWGLSFGTGTFLDKGSSTVTYTFTDIGIKLGLFWTKQKTWFNTITYNLQSTAKYNDGTNEVDLRGTSIKADLGYAFWPSETFALALKIVYYAPSFKESVSSGTLTTIAYTRSIIYPCINIIVSY